MSGVASRSTSASHLPREAVPGPRLWLYYLACGMTISAVYFAFPAYHLLTWTALGMSSVVASVVGIRRHRPRERAAWYLLAAGAFTLIAGDTTYNLLTQLLHQDNPFPSIADVFYLLTYPLIAAGVFLLVRGRSSVRDRASLIDALIVTTGLGLLSWVYLVVPTFRSDGLSTLQRFISVAYPLGDVLTLAMLARLVAGRGLRLPSMQFLVLGASGLLVADVLYGLIQLDGGWHVGGPVDLGWVVFYLAWGVAALHPSMVRVSEIPPPRSQRLRRSRVAVLAAVSLIAPGVLFAESAMGRVVHARTVAVFSAALFLLVIARLWGILDVHAQSVRREQILRSVSGTLVAAQGLPAIYQVALDGVLALTGATAVRWAALYLLEEHEIRCLAGRGVVQDLPQPAELRQAAADGGLLNGTGLRSVTPLHYDLEDRGVLVVDTATPLTLDQHGALATLAAQVALAVDSANLAEDLRRRRSEEQFQGILQNTSDIIVIVDRRGRITYGTPSLARTLGRRAEDIVGCDLVDFLGADDAADAVAMIGDFVNRTIRTTSVADWRLRHADGSVVAFEVLSSNLLDDPRVGGIVLTMRDVSERRALEVQLQHQAFHDPLTGLANRALFQDRAQHALTRTARRGSLVAMLMLDLDDFKTVNDTRGHGAGDDLLLQVAARLESTLRAGATVSRFGGDEFAILVEDLDDVTQAEHFADRTLLTLNTPFAVQGEELTVRASVGLVVSGGPHEWLDVTELMRCADLALYAAKERGKGRVVLYHRELHTRMLDRFTRRADLERALVAHEFVLLYQPIVRIETGELVGCEALVRWQHPTAGIVSPLDFVALTEETGMIVELGRWILDRACAQLRSWGDAGHREIRVSVNVSSRQFQEADFIGDVRAVLDRHRIAPGQLVLELTESLFALDAPLITEQLKVLRNLGIKIAMDDFGTGYSSLSYLQKFQLDILKIDKSFVDRLGLGSPDGGALVKAIISLADSLELDVVGEGIERPQQRDELWSMGCQLGQGYLYSKPVTGEALAALLSAGRPLCPLPEIGPPDPLPLVLAGIAAAPRRRK